MATVKVREIIGRVEHILQDSNVRWPRLELQSWINEAYLASVLLRPDANAKTGTSRVQPVQGRFLRPSLALVYRYSTLRET